MSAICQVLHRALRPDALFMMSDCYELSKRHATQRRVSVSEYLCVSAVCSAGNPAGFVKICRQHMQIFLSTQAKAERLPRGTASHPHRHMFVCMLCT